MAKQQAYPRKSSAKSDGPRDRILATANRLFYCQGYNSTGINQILEEANVAKASLYQHFGSKDELGVVYLKAARKDMFAGLEKWTADKESPSRQLLACFDYLEEVLRINEFRGCKFINMLSEIAESSPLMRKEIVEHKTKLREYMKSFVNRALDGDEKAEAIGDTIYLLFEGAIVETKIFKDTWPLTSARNMARRLLIDQA